ncbi:hypothetical protein KL86SPO_30939 [uncultured Sporomusa sp.]|uniref:Uncharacterized protein n=1 Tax=uncultured Sporomusa sp. TaxID=307249 RepID=A0A212LTE0_9FIRM|nr:hypothetical protein KL86SPO_30939 [uncultured Sporomusa sp.]
MRESYRPLSERQPELVEVVVWVYNNSHKNFLEKTNYFAICSRIYNTQREYTKILVELSTMRGIPLIFSCKFCEISHKHQIWLMEVP